MPQQLPVLRAVVLLGLLAVPAGAFSSAFSSSPFRPAHPLAHAQEEQQQQRHRYRQASTTLTMSAAAATVDCGVIIAGAGPAGLCCALALARRGMDDIHVVERNPSSEFFEVDKAYLYRIDGRGQRLTGLLGITERLQEVSVRTEEFVNVTICSPDGGVKVVPAPVDPTQQTAYWLPRRALIKFLVDQIDKEGYTSQIKFHWGIAVDAFLPPDGDPQAPTAQAVLRGRALGTGDSGVEGVAEGQVIDFRSQRVLGCDGMNSRVRSGLEAWAAAQDAKQQEQQPQQQKKGKKSKHRRFGLRYVDSPSAGLRYKILTLEDGFPLTAAQPTNITERTTCYSYIGMPPKRKLFGRFRPPLRLGLLPYKMQGIQRTANIITQADAVVFGLKTGPEVLAFLQRELPQCAVDKMVSPQEAERFAQSPGGVFPRPQYALEAQQVLAGGQGGVVLLGDAIHAFPPDLGAGVNSAFEDVMDFIFSLDRADGNWGEALPYYEHLRAPQSEAICKLIPIGFPHQYNHMHPLSKAVKLAGVGARAGLHKLFPFLFAPPVFFMVQDPRLDFAVVLKRATRTTRILQAIGAVLFTAVAGKMGWLTRPDEKAKVAWSGVVGVWARVWGGGKGTGAAGAVARE